ncbi:hypothetical protein N9Y60_01140 [Crocinitomicaceae bacterium]|nr:hypothetical protein [Crocinitomicaceae bacterium]MDB3906411.1 hypothetical protein [Crocinitomicaceae bacterium]
MRNLLLIIFLSSSIYSFGQEKGALSFEVAGAGGFGSISYSKEFKKWDKLGLEYRAGLSFVPIDKNNGNGIIFPLLVHATYGNGKHLADVGLGQAITVTTRGSAFVRMPTSFGYRLQTDGAMFYRFAYTPIVS